MNIKTLNIKNLYGYLTRTIEFKDRLSILVGPNGSGKTTILNVLNWVLSPNISMLCSVLYDEININFNYNNKDFFISCRKTEDTFTYELRIGNKAFHPLTVNLSSYRGEYDTLRPENEEILTWKRIQSLPKPLFIGLDRLLFSVENDVKYADFINQKKKVAETPIQRALSMAREHFVKQNTIILNLTKELNNTLILSNFHELMTLDYFQEVFRANPLDVKKTEQEINDLKVRVEHYLVSFLGLEQEEIDKSRFNNYFKGLISSLHRLEEDDISETEKKVQTILTELNLHSFKRLKVLMNDFDRFEKRINTIMYRIDTFLNSINFFFNDTGKKISINRNNGDLKVMVDGNKKHIGVDNLSSGEQQLIVIFAYLIFYTGKDQLFLIDEPELSLHVKWQENLLKIIDKANGQNNQIVVSTHSPLIVSSFRENTIPIRNSQNGKFVN